MKALLFDQAGKQTGSVELPSLFSTAIRADMVAKVVESEKFALMQPYSTFDEAGKRHSASGTISHRRHEWKGHYGKGISRVPRKAMWRRGTQFYWVGAEVSAARGGRVAHPPVGPKAFRKINQKERTLALHSALAATAHPTLVKAHYTSLTSAPSVPAVIQSLPTKTAQLMNALKAIFGSALSVAIKEKSVRAGKGKRRGRKYKSSAGVLVITGNKEVLKTKAVDSVSVAQLRVHHLFPLGRLVLYTKQSLEELA